MGWPGEDEFLVREIVLNNGTELTYAHYALTLTEAPTTIIVIE